MADKNFSFIPENMKDAGSFQNKAICFVNHLNFNLKDGDRVAIYSNYAAITRHDTGKTGLYRADNGIPILCDVFDTIEIKHNDSRMKKYAEHDSETLFFEVSVGDCYGAYSEHGLQLVPVKYKKGIIHFDGYYIVTSRENGARGVYNDKGRLIVPIEYETISIRYGVIVASKRLKFEKKEYAFNKYGQSLFHEMFQEEVSKGYDKINVYEECIITRENGFEEVFTKEGLQIITKKMKVIFIEKKYIIAEDLCGKYGAYAFDGKVLIAHEYDRMTRFGSDYIKGRYGNSECLFHRDGSTVIRRGIYQRITETKYGARATAFDGTKHDFELRMHNANAL